jgi:site-specific recombinase XerD
MKEAPVPASAISGGLANAEIERAKAYGRAAKSPRTRHEYARDWAHFAAWCAERGVAPLPASPPVVARYLASLGEKMKIASIRRRTVAISQCHKERGLDSPTTHKLVREVLAGIARIHGAAQQQKNAITAQLLAAALETLDSETLRGRRDRAVMLVGFAGAFRRSELAALNVVDLAFDRRGVTVNVPRSKTDQARRGPPLRRARTERDARRTQRCRRQN